MKSKNYFAQEIEIDLQKYWLVVKRRWPIIIAVCGLTTALATLAAISKTDVFEAEAKLLFESDQTASLIGLEGASRELKALTSQGSPLDTQVEIFRSIPIAEKVIAELNIKDNDDEPLKPTTLLEYLDVEGIPGTDVLSIAYESADPVLAAAIVNTIMAVYIENDIQVNRAAATAAQDFIAAQLPQTEAEVSAAESALSQFKEANQIVDLVQESENTVQVLSDYNDSVTQLKAQLADSTAKAAEIQQRLRLSPQETYDIGLVSESPGVQEVLIQLQAVEAQLAVERTRYEETHPAIARLRRQAESLNSLLNQRVDLILGDSPSTFTAADLQAGELEQSFISEFLRLEAERSGLAQRIETLSDAQLAQQARAQILPNLEKRQRELERRLSAAQSTYATLLENQEQARVIENQSIGNARIVSPALVPEDTTGLSNSLYIAAGLLGGTLLGITAAFVTDLIDRSIKTIAEGQSLYDYPLLGGIPAWQKLPAFSLKEQNVPAILVQEPQPVPIIEAYQALQANLKFSYIDKPLKTITITSSVAGEGKSEVVANLALTLAQLGHLVLVMDADMRNPIQHHVWDIPNLQGLTSVLAGQIPLENAIVRNQPNLHVLPVGVIPPNPLALLASQQMTNLLQQCEKNYDYILLDTPAVLGLADTLTLAKSTDGVLLVMQIKRTDANSITQTKALLQQSQQTVLGIVANGIRVKSKPDHYFYYNQEYAISQNQSKLLGLSQIAERAVVIANSRLISSRKGPLLVHC
ncbi:MAG: polysaccharide biosynthesis tyrosine autokinase [Phormidesmis sp. RL_2_1]|nr:polysaccharide biosynthesis tyrosine autokinase [Phormidesmis sp. RL_2_1]